MRYWTCKWLIWKCLIWKLSSLKEESSAFLEKVFYSGCFWYIIRCNKAPNTLVLVLKGLYWILIDKGLVILGHLHCLLRHYQSSHAPFWNSVWSENSIFVSCQSEGLINIHSITSHFFLGIQNKVIIEMQKDWLWQPVLTSNSSWKCLQPFVNIKTTEDSRKETMRPPKRIKKSR